MTVAELTYQSAFKAGLKPTDFITVSEWADKYRIIPKDGGAKEPGQWRTARFPFLKEIMDNLSPFSGVQFTIVMAGTQVGKTECGHNFMGHTIHVNPSPMLIMLPTIEVAKRRSRTKIKHTIDKTPVLKERVADPRERDSDNTVLFKAYPGGALIISGANSAASLRDISVRNIHLDELDAYEMDLEKEGDTVSLALKRADAFGDEKRVLETSTPTLKDFSKIEKEYENSDQRHLYLPCPHCWHMQYLRWKDGKWNGDGAYRFVFSYNEQNQVVGPVRYRCEHCSKEIEEYHKTWMLERHEWRPHNAGHPRRGYHLPAFYSPLGFLSWHDIVQEYLDARKEKDIEKLKTWKNTRLAETWDEENDIDMESSHNLLMLRREDYGAVVPMQGLLLVAGADVQRDRVEINVAALGIGEEWFNMEYRIISGSIAEKSVQQELDDFLFAPWLHASGAEMKISRVLIDSGDGVNTQEIYDYVKPRQKRGVYASKGSQFYRKPVVERSKKVNQSGIRQFNIGTDSAKDSIFARLSIPAARQKEAEVFKPLTGDPVEVSPMYIHWNTVGYDEEYFLQLFAEVVKKERRGRKYVRYYKQVRPRNEALDTAVLCLAAYRMTRPNWKKIVERLGISASQVRKQIDDATFVNPPTGESAPQTERHRVTPPVKRQGGMRVISRGISL